MSKLDGIPIRVEGAPITTDNATSLLHEIRHALIALLESGHETTIDLQSLPLSPADEKKLFDTLGNGEVEAHLNALGKSTIRETRIPGVWFIEHLNMDEQSVGRYIGVTHIPAILKAQPEDIQDGLDFLSNQLATRSKE